MFSIFCALLITLITHYHRDHLTPSELSHTRLVAASRLGTVRNLNSVTLYGACASYKHINQTRYFRLQMGTHCNGLLTVREIRRHIV